MWPHNTKSLYSKQFQTSARIVVGEIIALEYEKINSECDLQTISSI